MTEATLSGISPDLIVPLFGARDQYVRRLRDEFHVTIVHRDGSIRIVGEADDVTRTTTVLERLRHILSRRGAVLPEDFDRELRRIIEPDRAPHAAVSFASAGVQRAGLSSSSVVSHAQPTPLGSHGSAIVRGALNSASEPTGIGATTPGSLLVPPLPSPHDASLELTFQGASEIRPRTPGQKRYATAIAEHDVVFATGPAGTGKTYMAVAMAVSALRQRRIRKIVLVRPAVEAGESLGFLPGDLLAKINPYLRPLLDALQDFLGYDQARKLLDQDVIEVVPLAYMRGRTLNEAFIILDEAQNTTESQMKMFLTRMGTGSKVVVSGDITQTDLPKTVRSGLRDALERLANVAGIGFVRLTAEDIVRHPLVQRIVDAYEQSEAE